MARCMPLQIREDYTGLEKNNEFVQTRKACASRLFCFLVAPAASVGRPIDVPLLEKVRELFK